MMNFNLVLTILCVPQLASAADYKLRLTSNEPVVIGGTVQFKAQLFYGDKQPDGYFRFYWEDNSLYRNSRTNEIDLPYDSWNVTYANNPPGPYEIQVTVSKYVVFYYTRLTSQRLVFELTDELNGMLNIIQNNKSVDNFVSNNKSVIHEVSLKESDANYLKNASKSALTYWFIDCEYHGITDNFKYIHHYNHSDVQHHVEALVVAGYEPLTTTTVPTTTTTTTTTTSATTTITSTTSTSTTTAATSTSPAVTTTKLQNDQHHSGKTKRKRSTSEDTTKIPHEIVFYNGSNLISSNKQFNLASPFICNGSVVPMTAKNTFGYFSKSIMVKAPVSKLAITGNNWILQGNILQLQISCQGSKPFQYCLNYFPGIYNVTGNETCVNPQPLDNCNFDISRYYGSPGSHTIVVIITNDVQKVITPITVTVYEVTKQAQLSVIVVPVTFSIVAIILIVFGVAYYLQNRSRFTVEVADFNFGPQYADYMTFRERLRDSIMNSFTRTTVNTEENDSGPIWPPNQKYGSMPRF